MITLRDGRNLPLIVASLLGMMATGCSTGNHGERNDRSKMQQANVTIKGHTFKVAVARTSSELQLGLMNVKAEELGPDEGMLFVFGYDQELGFWMKNTLIPLDIAFINSTGRIVRIHTMKALDLSSYPSGEPAKYALEVKAGRFAALSIGQGDTVTIQESVLKP
jgi:uncharacterized protein